MTLFVSWTIPTSSVQECWSRSAWMQKYVIRLWKNVGGKQQEYFPNSPYQFTARPTALASLLFVPPGLIEQRVTDSPRGCCPISSLPAPNGWVRAPIGWSECGKECREGFTRTGSMRSIYKYRWRVAVGDSTCPLKRYATHARVLIWQPADYKSYKLADKRDSHSLSWPSRDLGYAPLLILTARLCVIKNPHTEYKHVSWFIPDPALALIMPADNMEKQTASPIAGAPASGSHTPDKPKNASEHRKVNIV